MKTKKINKKCNRQINAKDFVFALASFLKEALPLFHNTSSLRKLNYFAEMHYIYYEAE
jgi:hypothetical protein